MKLVLNIYTDETLTEVARVVESDRLKIPYRVVTYVANQLEVLDVTNEDDIFRLITSSTDEVEKVIKATFGLTDNDLDYVDAMELGTVGMELYKWVIEKMNSIKAKNGGGKNLVMTASL